MTENETDRTVEWEYSRIEQQHIRDANRAEDRPEDLSFAVTDGVITAHGPPTAIRWLYDYLHYLKRAWRAEGEQWDADVAEKMAESLYDQLNGEIPERQRAKQIMTDGGFVESETDQFDDLHVRTHGELKRRLAQNLGTDESRYSEDVGNERHKRVTREEIDRICEELGLGFLEDESKLQKQSSIMLKLGRDHRTEVRSWDSSDLRAVIKRLEEDGPA